MNLPVPVVGIDPGPDYALNVDACLALIDSHNHSLGQGVQIMPSGLNINSDLTFLANNAILLRSVRFSPQGSAISGAADLGCLYEAGVDLYYNDGNGNQVRITQGGSVSGATGTITGLPSGTASASFSGSTFTWQSATNTSATMDGGPVIIRQNTASAKGITLQSPNSLGANYTLTLPTGLASSTQYVTSDNAGNLSYSTADQIGVAMTSTGANAVANTRTRTIASTAGVGGIARSSSSGIASTTSATYTNITNLSVTITTSGRPVWVGLFSDGSASESYLLALNNTGPIGLFRIINNTLSSNVAGYRLENVIGGGATTTEIIIPSTALAGIDGTLAAGTYTYLAQFQSSSGTTTECVNAVLVAYEL